ncbi:MAG: helix-turn-helix domain-containing protein [Candidatus Hydrogenedentes bacterium]|nr:helix-turn-helix domain-containing protein [Candidatus Hydrogenedentota bacterium]
MLQRLAERIRSRREARGLKQQDIANALNVSPQAVSKWERGENAPDILLLPPLARLLDVSIDWLLSAQDEGRDVFEATVFVSGIDGAFRRSLDMDSRDYATWLNGMFFALTEATQAQGGVPIKYVGDGYLCFFSGADHRERAVESAVRAAEIVNEDLKIGLSCGEIFLGSVGHPEYARPDVMGQVVNVAFLTMEWAQANTESGIAATSAVVDGLAGRVRLGKKEDVHFRNTPRPCTVCEIRR